MSTPTPAGYATGRTLRPSAKSLPEHSRSHNRALVLQTLYRAGGVSRADLARATGLTRVTISDLVAQLIGDDLVVELGQRTVSSGEGARPGKPATLRAIEAMEHANSPEAVALLKEMATRGRTRLQQEEAGNAIKRLSK